MVTERLKDSVQEHELSSKMKQAQTGDKIAYHQLLEKVQILLQSFVKNLLMKMQSNHPSDSIHDIVQDILLGIHTKRSTYDPEQFFLPWMYAIARYKVIDHIRKRAHQNTFSLDESKNLERFHSKDTQWLTGVDLQKILAQLPRKQQKILTLVKIQGLSMQEVALQTGFSISDIKVSVHRAMKTLQESVSNVDGGSDENI